MSTLEGGKDVYACIAIIMYNITMCHCSAYCSIYNLNYMIDLITTGVALTWRRPDPPNGLITQYTM